MKGLFEPFYKENELTTKLEIAGKKKTTRIVQRADQFSGSLTNISEERAKRPLLVLPTIIKYEQKCDFCSPYKYTPAGRIEHSGGALSIRNLFPWEGGQWVTIYPPYNAPDEDRPILHKVHLSELTFQDMIAFIESSYDLAKDAKQGGAAAFFDFTNWGPYSGASRQHPHSQRTWLSNLSPGIFNFILVEMERCHKYYEIYKENLFDRYIREEEKSERKIFSNDYIYIGAPWAPHRPDEMIVIPKIPFASIVDTNRQQREQIMRPILGVFHCLHYYLRITNFNMYVHMAPFVNIYKEDTAEFYRWHLHIVPRKSSLPVEIGGAELGTGLWVVDRFPEATAKQGRDWYSIQF